MSFILRNSIRSGLRNLSSKPSIFSAQTNNHTALQTSSILSQSRRTIFGKKFDGSDKTKRAEEKTAETNEESTTTPPPSAEEAEQVCEKTAEIERLTSEVEKLTTEAVENDKRFKLQLADLINTNKRVSERHAKELKYAPKKFAKSMLAAYDDMQRAIDHAPKDIDDQPDVKVFVEGIKITQVNLEKTFNKHEISRIEVNVGDEFDPNMHDAAVKLPLGAVPDVGANQVAFIQTVGWRYRDIELRAPKVGVITE
jgi:molecular chaperone GrpE